MADPEIAEAYRNAPAAKTLHHAFIGGLLEHVVSFLISCDLNVPQLSANLIATSCFTGAFLHDIGKIHELTFQSLPFLHDTGPVARHMIIELKCCRPSSRSARLPDSLKTLVEHLIISPSWPV